jgi:uncharacterized protein YcfJ
MKYLIAALAFLPVVTFAQHSAEVIRIEPRIITTHQQQCQEVVVQVPESSGNAAGGVPEGMTFVNVHETWCHDL